MGLFCRLKEFREYVEYLFYGFFAWHRDVEARATALRIGFYDAVDKLLGCFRRLKCLRESAEKRYPLSHEFLWGNGCFA